MERKRKRKGSNICNRRPLTFSSPSVCGAKGLFFASGGLVCACGRGTRYGKGGGETVLAWRGQGWEAMKCKNQGSVPEFWDSPQPGKR